MALYKLPFSSVFSYRDFNTFQSVRQFLYVLCYTVYMILFLLIFSLIKVHNDLWEDIIQEKQQGKVRLR